MASNMKSFLSPKSHFGQQFKRLLHNEEGSILVYMTLAFPAMVGMAALGAEGGSWLYKQRMLQSAADNAAYSAATAYANSSSADITAQARAITANDYNLVDGVNGVTVTVNRPPAGTCYSGTSNFTGANAIEVVVNQSQTPFLSKIWLSNSVGICGRAVAIVPGTGDCVLALTKTKTGIGTDGKVNNLNINLTDCNMFSNSSDSSSIAVQGNNDVLNAAAIGAVGGIALNGNQKSTIYNSTTGDPPIPDPYASDAASWPQTGGASQTNCAPKQGKTGGCTPAVGGVVTLSPGTYAQGIVLDQGNTTYHLNAGIYYLSGDFTTAKSVNHVTVTGTNVTLVLLSNSAITLTSQNTTVNISAPTASGWNQGIAIWEPTSTGTNNFIGNSANITIQGVIYAPKADLKYTGNTAGTPVCTQIVANTVEFGGNSVNLTGDCAVPGMKTFGAVVALVE